MTRIFCCVAPSRIILVCAQATHAVSKLLRQKDAVFFCSQNIAEFWNVATRPAGLNGLGLSHEEASHEVSRIEELLTLLPDVLKRDIEINEALKQHRGWSAHGAFCAACNSKSQSHNLGGVFDRILASPAAT